MSTTWHTTTPSTLGELTLVRDAGGIRGVYFPHHRYRPEEATCGPSRADGLDETIFQLGEYLAGTRVEFDLPLAPRGDDVQRRVWDLIAQIPYGDTVTYGELAARVGGATTAREIGRAAGRNPLSILVGCHRVVGPGGRLTGYAGGLTRKRHLLELEADRAAAAAGKPLQLALATGPGQTSAAWGGAGQGPGPGSGRPARPRHHRRRPQRDLPALRQHPRRTGSDRRGRRPPGPPLNGPAPAYDRSNRTNGIPSWRRCAAADGRSPWLPDLRDDRRHRPARPGEWPEPLRDVPLGGGDPRPSARPGGRAPR